MPPNPSLVPDVAQRALLPATCGCGHRTFTKRSEAMLWGFNTARVRCPGCRRWNHGEIAADGHTMTLEPWEAWRARWTGVELPSLTVHRREEERGIVVVLGRVDPAMAGQYVLIDGDRVVLVVQAVPYETRPLTELNITVFDEPSE